MLNSICIVGRFVADPELRMTSTNTPVTTFTVAVDRDFVKAGEERQTDFLDVVAWRQTAEFVTKFFRKGSLIAVQGSLQVRNYEDKNGNKRKAYEIVAANEEDLARGRDNGMAEGLLDRLRLDAPRVAAVADALRDIAALPDPVLSSRRVQLWCHPVTAGLLVTLLAGPFLGERIGAGRWAAVIVGFAGVLLIARPGGALQFALRFEQSPTSCQIATVFRAVGIADHNDLPITVPRNMLPIERMRQYLIQR